MGTALKTRRLQRWQLDESQICWVLGSPRSGSTWLWQMLRGHRQVVPINEPLIGMYLGPFLCDLPGQEPDLLDLQNFTLRRQRGDHLHHFFADSFREVWEPGLARLIRERFEAQARQFVPEAGLEECRVVVKEPNGSQSADVLLGCQPRSRLVFLLRDGRDVVDSDLAAHLEGAWGTQHNPGMRGVQEHERLRHVKAAAFKWLWRTQVVDAAYTAHPGPKLRLRYEDLLEDTAGGLRAVHGCLALESAPDDVSAVAETFRFENLPEDQRGATSFYRSAQPGSWRLNLRPEEQSLLHEILGPELRRQGYGV